MKIPLNLLVFVNLVIGFSLLTTGCNNINEADQTEASTSTQLTVSAAASLKDVMEEIETIYEEKYPRSEIIYNFASSGSLQRQIEQGAPVDMFISASVEKMNTLEKQDLLLSQSRRDLVENKMVLVVPKNRDKSLDKIDDFGDLTDKNIEMIALGEPKSVPAGKYAQEVLNFYQIADEVNQKSVYGKDVRQVLNYVATGNVSAGIVYSTDAKIESNVEIISTAPAGSHSPVIYPVAVIKDSDNPEESQELIEFFTSPEIQQIFSQYGFTPINSNSEQE